MHVDHATPPPPAAPPAADLTAGRYLTLRREAAGLPTVTAAVAAAGAAGLDVFPFVRALQRAEADEVPLTDAQLGRLQRAFPFDPFIYQCLRDGVPAGRICVGCGCSWNDACMVGGQPCAWTSAAIDFCSRCAAPATAPAGFEILALSQHNVGSFLAELTAHYGSSVPTDARLVLEDGSRLLGMICTKSGDRDVITLLSDRSQGGPRQ